MLEKDTTMRRIFASAFALLLLAATAAASAAAAELPKPAGPVVLTIHGNIAHSNRGPVDPFMDAFFQFGNVKFDRAAAFDYAMLEKLGMHKLRAKYETWPLWVDFEGPLLRDVLKAAGMQGTSLKVFAIDNYGAEIPLADTQKYDIVLALKANGRWLGLGDRGPTWVIYPRDQHPELKAHDDAKWVWSAIRIEAE